MLKLPVKYPIDDENIDLSEYAKKSDVDAIGASLDNKADKKEVEKISSQLDTIAQEKISKNDGGVITNAMLSQEVKESISGGSVAVVGIGAINNENTNNNCITPRNINKKYKKNLNDLNFITDNTFILNTTGEIRENPYFYATDYIPVKKGLSYIISSNKPESLGAFYNSDKTFNMAITGLVSGDDTKAEFTSHIDGYIRITVDKRIYTNYEYLICLKDDYYIEDKIEIDWLKINNSNLSENFKIDFNQTTFLNEYVVNLFNKNSVKNGFFINSNNGNEVEFSGWSCTNYIEIAPNTMYVFTNTSDGAFYNDSKQFIKGVTNINYAISPSNAKYYRASLKTNEIDSYMFCKDKLPDKYIEFGKNVEISSKEFKNAILSLFNRELLVSERFKGKTLLVTGDSITESNSRASKNWHDYLKEYLGFNIVINDGRSGTGLIRNYGGYPGIVDRLHGWQADVDYILIMGNMNDGTSGEVGVDGTTPLGNFNDGVDKKYETVCGALHYMYQELIKKYPNVPIGFITSTPRSQVGVMGKCWGQDGWFAEWNDMLIKISKHYSIPCLDLYNNSGLRPWNSTNKSTYFSNEANPEGDGVHPNSLGQEIIALKVLEFVKQYM